MKRVEKSNVLMVLHEDKDLDCMYSDRSLEYFRNPHIIQITFVVTLFTVNMKPRTKYFS